MIAARDVTPTSSSPSCKPDWIRKVEELLRLSDCEFHDPFSARVLPARVEDAVADVHKLKRKRHSF